MNIEIGSPLLQGRHQIPSSVRAVLFDAVGTLIYPQPTVAEAYWMAGQRFGSGLDEKQVQTRFRAAFQRQETLDAGTAGHRTSRERELRRWQAIVAEVFDDVPDGDALFAALWDHFARAEHWALFDDAPPAWARLKQAGLRLAIASNFDERLPVIVGALSPLGEAERVFVSSELGCRKPSRGFFQAIERALDLRPEQLLLVGDDVTNDYYGALAAGWHAVLLRREPYLGEPAEQEITSLGQLLVAP